MRRGIRRGVSLIEAIVAMAVMAFGMMAIVGLQATLRQNSDIAKQRSEAVRIAEKAIEQWRAYATLGAYDGIDIGEQTDPPTTGLNATYTLKRTVAPGEGWKSIAIQVSWVDRSGQIQSVTLNSIIAAADPALSGILTMQPGGGLPVNPPLGRNPAIPVGADVRGDRSIFMPLGPGGGVLWVFDNLTGVIVGVCNTVVTGQAQVTQADTQACVDSTTRVGVQLSGFVRFSTGFTQPTAANSENPTSTAFNLAVALALTSTGHASPDHICYTDAPTSATPTPPRTSVRYYCAVFFNTGTGVPPVWTGTSTLKPLAFLDPADDVPWALADDTDDARDARASRYRVCRYTPAISDTEPIPNQWHPRTYTDVTAVEQLTNQNFLVIRAGDDLEDGNGGTAFTCPTDVPADPANGDFVNSNTLPHQPPLPTPP